MKERNFKLYIILVLGALNGLSTYSLAIAGGHSSAPRKASHLKQLAAVGLLGACLWQLWFASEKQNTIQSQSKAKDIESTSVTHIAPSPETEKQLYDQNNKLDITTACQLTQKHGFVLNNFGGYFWGINQRINLDQVGTIGMIGGDEYWFSVGHCYKIHLMPKKENVYRVFSDLLAMLSNNPLCEAIKIKNSFTSSSHVPLIVIYVIPGKENAQQLLNLLYKHFKTTDGSDQTPRYNRKTTSLLFYAQGDGDFKEKSFAPYYESGDDTHKTGRVHLNQGAAKRILEGISYMIQQGILSEKFEDKFSTFITPYPTLPDDFRLINPATGRLDD